MGSLSRTLRSISLNELILTVISEGGTSLRFLATAVPWCANPLL